MAKPAEMDYNNPMLSIIIINHNTPALAGAAIASVISHTREVLFEIIVVNNGSEALRFEPRDPRVKAICVENKGFGHACNAGAAASSGELLLFLNPDTLVHEGALDSSAAYMLSHPDTGALGIQTRMESGAFDHGCKRGFPTPWASFCYFTKLDRLFPHSRMFGQYRQTFVPEDAVCAVDAVSGAFLMTPRAVFTAVGGFDEAFFMYGEDLDLCFRIKQYGRSVVYCGRAQMTHLKGESGLKARSKAVVNHFYDAMELFFAKHYAARCGALTAFLVSRGIRFLRKRALRGAI